MLSKPARPRELKGVFPSLLELKIVVAEQLDNRKNSHEQNEHKQFGQPPLFRV